MSRLLDSVESMNVWMLDVDWSGVEWKELFNISDFKWTLGQTPFSHLQVPVFIGIFYIVSLLSLQNYMKDKKPFVLKGVTLVHNAFLSLLSLVMFLGCAYGAYLKYQAQGFWAGLVCEQDPNPIKGPMFYWCYIFYLSKFYELIDSYLLVLKKKPLIFLHVFHHTVMPFVCWAGLEGKWCMALWTSCFWNSLVHVVMYYYYFVSTLGSNPWWKKYLTRLQIYQFITGVVYTWGFFYYYFQDVQYSSVDSIVSFQFRRGCAGDPWAVVLMFSVNNSFLFLFTKFYLENYKSDKNNKKTDNQQTKSATGNNAQTQRSNSTTKSTKQS